MEKVIFSHGEEAKVDVAVLLIFFNRPSQLATTFEPIKKARPSKLYLYQDGPRNEKDIDNIEKCRQVVSGIDWECEIHQLYQKKNYGCDPSEFISQKWMFSTEEKGIIIEDDDVMSVSFFRFCKELLDKYENDTRINMICGMNHLGIYEKCPDSYFFTTGGGIWGWATWRRVIDEWDSKYQALEDNYTMNLLKRNVGKSFFKLFIQRCYRHLKTGREHYESIQVMRKLLSSSYNIVPKYNMTCNIGLTDDSTHSVGNINKLPRMIRRVLQMKTYEIEFPLKHPKYFLNEVEYKKQQDLIMNGNWFVRTFQTRRVESLLYRVFPFLGR